MLTLREMRLLRTLAVGTWGLLVSSSGVGSPETELQLDYNASVGCPTRDDFAQQLLGRSRYLDALKRTRVGIRVAPSEAGYTARLLLVDPDGNRVERDISGRSCSDVTAAIALIAAVTVDGAANLSTPSNALPAEAPAAANPAATPTPAPVDSANASAAPPEEVTQPTPTASSKQRPLPNNYSIGIVGGIHSEIAPTASPTMGLSGNYHPRTILGTPEYRIEALVGWSLHPVSIAFSNGTSDNARFLWIASRVAACPISLALATGSRLGPCALLELGLLRGSSSSGAASGPWFAPATVLDWSVQVKPLRLRVSGGAMFPIRPDSYKFKSGQEAHRAARVGLLAEFEMGWTFD